jgi:hypothetical protein
MNLNESNYQAYLLRLWRDGPSNHWRASLQSTKAGELQLFADVQSLLNFLQSQTAEPVHEGDDEAQGESYPAAEAASRCYTQVNLKTGVPNLPGRGHRLTR